MPTLQGSLSIVALPPHRGLMVHLALFAVSGPDAPVPYGGQPPAEAITDCVKVFEEVDFDKESHAPAIEVRFAVELPGGHYHVQVRAVLFRAKEGKMLAQAEGFFVGSGPILVGAESGGDVAFSVAWPTTPLEDLKSYGTVSPQGKRPWWKFW